MIGELRKPITDRDIRIYAELLGDTNPVHLDDEYAKNSRWKKRIAHGMISAGLIPTIFGSLIPGSIYVSQELNFKAPVYVNDIVVAKVKVLDIKYSPKHFVTCETIVVRESDNTVLINGKAMMMLPPPPPASNTNPPLQ